MDIKKIILEEIDDFDWAMDTLNSDVPLTEDNAHIGLEVRIAENSEYYYVGNRSNPINLYGKITNVDYPNPNLHIEVTWSNGMMNQYAYIDLVII